MSHTYMGEADLQAAVDLLLVARPVLIKSKSELESTDQNLARLVGLAGGFAGGVWFFGCHASLCASIPTSRPLCDCLGDDLI